MSMNEEFKELVQDATLLIARTAGPDEDTVKAAGDLCESLRRAFDRGGIESAKTMLEITKQQRGLTAAYTPTLS